MVRDTCTSRTCSAVLSITSSCPWHLSLCSTVDSRLGGRSENIGLRRIGRSSCRISYSRRWCCRWELNRPAFSTETFQTLIPSLFMYIPTGVMFIAPFFNIDLNANANFIVFCSFLYPGLDPLIFILIIRDFRTTIMSKKTYWITSESRYFSNNSWQSDKRSGRFVLDDDQRKDFANGSSRP